MERANKKKCFLLIDLQNDFFDLHEGGVMDLPSGSIVRNISRMLDFVRKDPDWIVVWVYSIYHEQKPTPVRIDVPGF